MVFLVSFWIRSVLITDLMSIFHQQGIAYISVKMHCQITITEWNRKKRNSIYVRHRQLSLPPGDTEVAPQPWPGAVPTPGAPGELEGNRRPSGQRRGCFQRSQFSCLFVWWDMGWNVYMREVSNYGLSCSWILLFAGWSTTKKTNRNAMKEIGCI